MIKKTALFLVLLISASLFSQQINFDKYQYIIVLDKFDFVKETNQYQTSSLTKFLLKKKGFKVFLSNENLPEVLSNNKCLSLFATVKENSTMFTIKNTIEIKDCYGKTLYTSEVGKSKEKDYKNGYQEAIRDAYESMTDFKYSYNSSLVDVKKEEKKEAVIADIISDKVVIPIKTTPKVVLIPDVKTELTKEKKIVYKSVDFLYSQPKNNGFQLVNTKPEIVFLILKTNVKDVFIIKDKDGILYKVGGNWVAEFYENNQLITKEYQIKF
jgi:hypothetical protein